jgi:hypothetical protein
MRSMFGVHPSTPTVFSACRPQKKQRLPAGTADKRWNYSTAERRG